MKKQIIIIVTFITLAGILTGCGKKESKEELIGKWTTKYELGMYGEITQTYEFQKDKTCKKTLITDMVIENSCTYEKKDNTIEITYSDGKTDSLNYRMEEDKLILGGYTHTKED